MIRDRELEVAAVHVPARRRVHLARAGCCTAASPIEDRAQTRKSFVVHYCTAANYDVAYREHARARRRRLASRARARTDTVIERGHGRGLDNPLRT